MLRYFLFIFIVVAVYPQTIDERLLLIETKKLLTYMHTFEQISIEEAEEYAIASNVANSISRSIIIVMNAYHLVHIYYLIQGEEDRGKVRDYLINQLPRTLRLLKIELTLSSKFIATTKNKVIKQSTESYINSLDFLIKLLKNFS